MLNAEDVGSTPALILLGSKASGVLTTRPVLGINNHTTRLMTILASGNVGAGTTTPAGPLHVKSSSSAINGMLVLENDSGTSTNLYTACSFLPQGQCLEWDVLLVENVTHSA